MNMNLLNAEDTLPDIPSELIRVALSDLEKCELDDRYVIDMKCWHSPNYQYSSKQRPMKCHVCLSGAIMAKQYNLNNNDYYSPAFLPKAYRKLMAIDSFCNGYVLAGLLDLGYKQKDLESNIGNLKSLDNVNIIPYNEDQSKFKEQMNELADFLEENGY